MQLTLKLMVSPGCTDSRSEYPVIGSMSSLSLLFAESVTVANRGSCIESSKDGLNGPPALKDAVGSKFVERSLYGGEPQLTLAIPTPTSSRY
jgi:hypothetical protein